MVPIEGIRLIPTCVTMGTLTLPLVVNSIMSLFTVQNKTKRWIRVGSVILTIWMLNTRGIMKTRSNLHELHRIPGEDSDIIIRIQNPAIGKTNWEETTILATVDERNYAKMDKFIPAPIPEDEYVDDTESEELQNNGRYRRR